jgi:signal transduction histidine kinase
LARSGWLIALVPIAAIQAYLLYPSLAFAPMLFGSTLVFPVLTLIVAFLLERRLRRLEHRLDDAEWERDTLRAALEDRASEDARARRKLVSTVSHELRTPLASVVGLAELLLLRDHAKAERQQYLRAILDETQRLTSILDELLSVHPARRESLPVQRDSPLESPTRVIGGRS